MNNPEDDLENYESAQELNLYKEYRDVVGLFRYVVETERRFYLANAVEMTPRFEHGDVYFEIEMKDAWVWDVFRPSRFLRQAKVLSFKDVNIEELHHGNDLDDAIASVHSEDRHD